MVISVLLNGHVVNYTSLYPGSLAHIEIFKRNSERHTNDLKETDIKTTFEDICELLESYTLPWSVFLDKGHTGLADNSRANISWKLLTQG